MNDHEVNGVDGTEFRGGERLDPHHTGLSAFRCILLK